MQDEIKFLYHNFQARAKCEYVRETFFVYLKIRSLDLDVKSTIKTIPNN